MNQKITQATCWIISDGRAGIEIQACGLAEWLNLQPIVKRITLKWPWYILPPQWVISPLTKLSSDKDILLPPWPDIIISSGKRAVAVSWALKKLLKEKICVICLQAPRIAPRHFDLVIAPYHDKLKGSNVLHSLGSIHSITSNHLKKYADKFPSLTKNFLPPYIGVLIGGKSKHHDFTLKDAHSLCQNIVSTYEKMGGSFFFIPSRRTPEKIYDYFVAFSQKHHFYIWDKKTDNPYKAILGLSDYLIVTADSVNMITESMASGKPTYIFNYGKKKSKIDLFHKKAIAFKAARLYTGQKLTQEGHIPYNDMPLLVQKITSFFDKR